MATEKRLIDANALYDIVEGKCKTTYGYFLPIYRWFADKVANAPTVDAVEVVRCKDCKHWIRTENGGYCDNPDGLLGVDKPDDFCSYGERRTDNDCC